MNLEKISLSDRVYETLRDAVLDRKYAPGEYLTELRLSGELGVSRTPIREALRRLSQDGIVEETPRGVLVVGVSGEEAAVIYEMRARIEGYAARLFTERVTDGMIAELVENIELQEFYSGKSADSERNLDTRFHAVIYENCGSRVLADTLSSLHGKVRLYRRAVYEDGERAKDAAREHRMIYEAIKARDAERAEALVTEHIENARAHILAQLKTKREVN